MVNPELPKLKSSRLADHRSPLRENSKTALHTHYTFIHYWIWTQRQIKTSPGMYLFNNRSKGVIWDVNLAFYFGKYSEALSETLAVTAG